uniref:CCHC-type domain-containing protein n=1 Tax=Fagus sylvatica TaxID=28930 RepID=A0A2N9J8T4_FAGSY
MSDENWEEMDEKAASAIRLNLGDEVIHNILEAKTAKQIWKKLKVNLEEEDKAILLLASLPTSFNHLVTTLMYGKETLELEEVTSALLSHSKMKQDGDDSQGDGLVVHSESNRNRNKSRGSNSNKERSQSRSRAKKDVECFYCHKKGHYKNQCKELKQHLEERKNEKKAAESASVIEEKSDDNEVDGDLLSVSSVIGISTMKIKIFDGVVRVFEDVRHILDLRKNLISLGVLDDLGYSYSTKGGVMKITKGTLLVMKGRKVNQLYRLIGNTVVGGAAVITSTKSSTDDTKLWHMRLGHIGERGMLELQKRNLLKGVKTCKLDFCKYCVYGKQPRVSFKTGSHTSKGVLDYVHSHVWGPVSVSSHSGAHYFISFIDDYSRKNEVAEKMNKTLAEKAKCIRLNAGLSKVFWAEAVNTANFIINISPATDNDFNIPQESGERTKLDPKSRKCIFLGFEKGVKGYRLWDPISKKKVISRDVILDETFMLKQNEEEVCEDSPKEKSTVEVEFDDDNLPSDKDNDEDDSQQQEEPYSIARGRGKRVHKAPQRYGFEDMVSFALITSSGVPLSYKDATNKKYS